MCTFAHGTIVDEKVFSRLAASEATSFMWACPNDLLFVSPTDHDDCLRASHQQVLDRWLDMLKKAWIFVFTVCQVWPRENPCTMAFLCGSSWRLFFVAAH